ncbi:MAG TPA: hypothetical protein PLH23_17015 [Hyphomonadaceae bacterium]|nr:hypothetical protein [Hyphomonadaceae bacterium]HPI49975.1 hypothetical protein [Hyphomonadaceae bacterium]
MNIGSVLLVFAAVTGVANAMGPKQFHELVMSFPETEVGTSYGHPSYKSFGKFLTRLRTEDDSVVLGCVPLDEREMLCEADPETFHVTDHYGSYPYVLARLKRLDAKTLRSYLTRQWRHNAPKKWLKAWEEGQTPPPVAKAGPKPRRATGSRKLK